MSDLLAQAEALEAQARDAIQRAHDSFERSDTDGCLTQWACGITADLRRRQAQILRDGAQAVFEGLYEGNRRVRARLIENQYGEAWLLDDEEAALFGRRFIPEGRKSSMQKKKGLHQALEWAPAAAKTASNGTGLSGNVWVEIFRTGCRWGSDATKCNPG
jgi:hypothetical protein